MRYIYIFKEKGKKLKEKQQPNKNFVNFQGLWMLKATEPQNVEDVSYCCFLKENRGMLKLLTATSTYVSGVDDTEDGWRNMLQICNI